MLPFLGRAHVAYIPNGKVLGLSKIPRIVDFYARRLQVQERMTRQIADFIRDLLQPQGVAVVIEGLHLCMTMRGVQKHNARMTTSAMHGAFRANLATRQEFLENIARGATPLQV
ncbi:MAG: GTP cyclohydrolase I [Anaerolineales bacterium]|nr:GTP cyclohydrolase I [Anaerolineales bacterium]